MIEPSNAFSPYIDGGGLSLGVTGGVALIGTIPTTVPGGSVALTANATNYVFLNLSSGILQVNTTGFGVSEYPIATVVTTNSGIQTLTDSRADVAVGSSSGGGSLSSASVTLSTAQIENLTATPVQVLAGVAGVYYSLQTVIAEHIFSGTPFTNNGASFAVRLGSTPGSGGVGVGNSAIFAQNQFLNVSVNTLSDQTANIGVRENPTSSSVNGVGIFVGTNGSGSDASGGNGTVRVTVYYIAYQL
jgi:hypothetical protein